jgi:hypothetical protein
LEIEKLRKEAEMFNNPSEYVKYAKIERQIAKLQKQLESIQPGTFESLQKGEKSLDATSLLSIPESTYTKIIIEVIFYIGHFFAIFWLKNQNLVIHKNSLKKANIIFDYYTDLTSSLVIIPINYILILEGFFLHKMTQIYNKIKKSYFSN